MWLQFEFYDIQKTEDFAYENQRKKPPHENTDFEYFSSDIFACKYEKEKCKNSFKSWIVTFKTVLWMKNNNKKKFA